MPLWAALADGIFGTLSTLATVKSGRRKRRETERGVADASLGSLLQRRLQCVGQPHASAGYLQADDRRGGSLVRRTQSRDYIGAVSGRYPFVGNIAGRHISLKG